MVGLIIAFPGIVSSGLDKKEVFDLDKVHIEMENSMRAVEPAPDPMTNAIPSAPTELPSVPGASPTPATTPMDDMQKAIEDSMKK